MAELSWRLLGRAPARLRVWAPILLIGLLHYNAPHDQHWVHDLARRLFYVPIVLGGTLGGLSGGLVTAGAVLLVYAPHAFLSHVFHDPGSNSEKLLEMAFYVVLGILSGVLAERGRQEQLRQAALAAQVQAQDLQLAQAARLEALGQLTAGLAHEIKNPLHAMRGTAEVLLDFVPEGDDARPLAEAHIDEIDRLDGVLRKFLGFARGQPPRAEVVDLAEVGRTVVDLVRAQAARQRTAVVLDAPAPVSVRADREQIVQVVLGIAINGLQALGEGGRIQLGVGAGAGEGWLRVDNDGPPLDEAVRARVFDPFFSTRESGTGLGLSIAWRIVDAHGGRLTAENLPVGAGVAFTVALPLAGA